MHAGDSSGPLAPLAGRTFRERFAAGQINRVTTLSSRIGAADQHRLSGPIRPEPSFNPLRQRRQAKSDNLLRLFEGADFPAPATRPALYYDSPWKVVLKQIG